MSILNDYRYPFSIAAGFAYGLTMRLVFSGHSGSSLVLTTFWVMTAGFLVVVPFVVGWITSSYGTNDGEHHWGKWIFAPWAAILLSDVGVYLGGQEGAICVLFALPITLTISSLGGVAAGLAKRSEFLQGRPTMLCLAVLPFLISAIEMQMDAPLQIRTVQTSIVIHAPAETIWRNIERVPAIAHAEIRPTWTHRIGFPLPVEATLDHEGVGGVRHASFEGGLLFIETITGWEPQRRITFSIAADTAHIPPTTLDEHVTVGGRYFDVLNGEYRLEPLPNGDTLLHLSSQERLSTDFNAYAALWSDAVMRDLQESILQVVKHRCERDTAGISATLKP